MRIRGTEKVDVAPHERPRRDGDDGRAAQRIDAFGCAPWPDGQAENGGKQEGGED
jgi:hypothetical protein